MDKIIFLRCFFEEPNRWYHLREFARINKISPSTALKYLDFFYKKKILKKKKEHNLSLYKAEDDSEDFRDMKIFWNIKRIKNSGVLDYLEDKFNPKGIVLFGSVAKGLDTKRSDIDIFVMSRVKEQINLEKYEKILKKPIQLFVLDNKALKAQKELANNIINGVILKGYIEVL